MLQDPFAFLSDNGGDDRYVPFKGMSSIVYGLVAGSGLVEKHLLRRSALVNLKRQARRYKKSIPSHRNILRQGVNIETRPPTWRPNIQQIEMNDTRTRAEVRAARKRDIRSIGRNVFRPYKAMSALLKSSAFAIGVTTLFEKSMDVFTPGVNKRAMESNNKFISESLTTDSNTAFTQRQRALQAIFDSQSSLRNVIGNEASYLHR